MAIRIDLLPRYVGLRRWFKRILLGCVSLVGVFAVVLFALYYKESLKLQTLQENRDAFESVAKKADAAQADATKFTTDAQPYRDTVAFFVDAGRTGPERAVLIDTVQRYIYREAQISLIDFSDGQNVKLTANVSTPDEYANLVNILRRGTMPTGIAFKDLPGGSGVNGWPSAGTATQGGAQTPAAQSGAGTGGSSIEQLGYRNMPIQVTLQGGMREAIVVPLPPGEIAAVNTAQNALGGAPPPPAAGKQ